MMKSLLRCSLLKRTRFRVSNSRDQKKDSSIQVRTHSSRSNSTTTGDSNSLKCRVTNSLTKKFLGISHRSLVDSTTNYNSLEMGCCLVRVQVHIAQVAM